MNNKVNGIVNESPDTKSPDVKQTNVKKTDMERLRRWRLVLGGGEADGITGEGGVTEGLEGEADGVGGQGQHLNLGSGDREIDRKSVV